MKIVMYADQHFRSDKPEARLDDYQNTQDKLIDWLDTEFKDHIHICAGDVVHRARERKDQIGFALYLASKLHPFYGVAGNHDLLYHSMDLIDKTTLGVLERAGVYKPLSHENPLVLKDDSYLETVYVHGFHYGEEIQHAPKLRSGVRIAVYHGMVTQTEEPFLKGITAPQLLKEFPEYDIILTGDNHKQFIVVDGDRAVINPGSLKRDNADQADHVPRVFVFDPTNKTMTAVDVPTDDDVLDRTHLEIVEQRNERLEHLTEKFTEARSITLDFHENVINYLAENDVDDDVELTVLEWLG